MPMADTQPGSPPARVPLFVILLGGLQPPRGGRLARWETSCKREVKLATGLVMVALGAAILLYS